MQDVNQNNNSASQTPGEGNSAVAPQTTEQKPVEEHAQAQPETAKPETPATERTIPYSRFHEVNEKLRKAQRELAEARGRANQPQYEDLDTVRSHPYVQELELNQAESELRRGAEDILQQYPNLHPAIKKAVLNNPRGYVSRKTTDVPNALLDIEEYVQKVLGEQNDQPVSQPKQFPVAGTNTPVVTQGPRISGEIEKILKKPVDEWTDAEIQQMEAHKASQS